MTTRVWTSTSLKAWALGVHATSVRALAMGVCELGRLTRHRRVGAAAASPGRPRRCQGCTLGAQLPAAVCVRLLGLVGLGAWGLDLGSGHCGLSLVSRGRRHRRVGAAALGNSVFRVVCICMGVGSRHAIMSSCFGLGRLCPFGPFGLPVLWVRSLGSRVSSWSCWQVLYLVLRVRARGPNSVHFLIRCTTHS